MVEFVMIYKSGHEKEFDDVPCFGSLNEEHDSFEADEGEEIQEIVYNLGHELENDDLIELMKTHPVLSKPVRYVDKGGYISVSPDYPADLVLGCLSFARTLFSHKHGFKVRELIRVGLKPVVAAFLVDSTTNNGKRMFRYIEESLVQDWPLRDFIDWLENPVDRSIEEVYSTSLTYTSIKTSLSGKDYSLYDYRESREDTPSQVMELITWEKGRDFIYNTEGKELC